MRAEATQASPTAHPDIRVTVDGDVYASIDIGEETARLVDAYEEELVWGGRYEFLIDNDDGALDDKDYKGKTVAVYHGFVGVTGSTIGTLWVDSQDHISKEGKMLLRLICYDIFGLLSKVKGTVGGAYWNYPWQSAAELAKLDLPQSGSPLPAQLITAISNHYDKTVQQIVTTTASDALGVTVDLDDDDSLTTTEKPQVSAVDARSLMIQAMNVSKSYLLWKADDKLHILQPDAHGSVYSYDTANLIYSNMEEQTVVVPNRVIYWYINKVDPTDPSTWLWASETAVDPTSYTRLGFYIDEHHNLEVEAWEGIANTAEASARADARLAKLQLSKSTGQIIAPMHCSQELFDAITITDNYYDTPRVYTGYVFSIIREYDRGVYKITLGLGGVEGGHTPPGGEDIRVTKTVIPKPPSDPIWIIPKAVQGYHHDLHFVADDQDTVSWGSGTITFYDGTTQVVAAGNTGNMANTTVRHIYFDLSDANPNVLKVTTDYPSVMTTKTGVLCLAQKGSSASKATVVPSYGKEPLITADVIYLTGLLDLLPDGLYGKTLATQVAAGYLKLTSGTVIDGEWYNESGVEIDAAHGINIYGANNAFTTRATKAGTIQCSVNSSGQILAGAGRLILDANGITIDGAGGAVLGSLKFIYGGYSASMLLDNDGGLDITNTGRPLYINCSAVRLDDLWSYDHFPRATNTYTLGSTSYKWLSIYRTQEFSCPLPTTNSALDVIRKIKNPLVSDGDFGRRHYFKPEDFPNEMKALNDEKKEDIELTKVTGILVQAIRELDAEIVALKARQR